MSKNKAEVEIRSWKPTAELIIDLLPVAKENKAVEIVILKHTHILSDMHASSTHAEMAHHKVRLSGIVPIIRALWREYVEQA